MMHLFLILICVSIKLSVQISQKQSCKFRSLCGANTYRDNNYDSRNSYDKQSELSCANRCAYEEHCYGINVCHNGDDITCDIIISNLTYKDECYWLDYRENCKYMEMTSCQGSEKCGLNQQKAAPVIENYGNLYTEQLSHDQSGTVISGNINNLISALEVGNDVRVVITSWENNSELSVTGQIFSWNSLEVCIQSILNGFTNGIEIYRRFLYVCSTGRVQLQDYELRNPVKIQQTVTFHSMKWFTSSKATLLYTCDLGGVTTFGNVQSLIDDSNQGFDFVIENNPGNYSMKVTSIETDGETATSFQAVWQLARGNMYSFKSSSYWYVPVISHMGRFHFVRWSVESQNLKFPSAKYLTTAWHVNKEWSHVYSNDKNGETLFGERSVLMYAIQKGHRVKVKVQNRTEEAKSIRIKNGEIWGQLLESVLQIDEQNLETNVTRVFKMVSTRGRLNLYHYHVCCDVIAFLGSFTEAAHWYIDTKPWFEIFSTNGYPSISPTTDLINRFSNGKSFRVGHFKDGDSTYLNVENVEVTNNNTVVAASTINIEPVFDPVIGYILSPTSYWTFVFTSSNGNITVGNGSEITDTIVKWYSSD